MASPAPLVKLDDIHLELKSDGNAVHILKGISLEVNPGETVSIMGPSGSGKTTLMMILSGLEKPSSGAVSIANQNLSALNEDALAAFRRNNIGIVFQNFHLIPTMTALENVAIPLEFGGAKDAFKKAEDALKAVGLGHRLTHYPGQLSGGEQQRVAIARAFVTEPKLLLADEPTGNLDAATGESVIGLLFDLTKRTKGTLMIVTHDAQLAKRCDRTVRLFDGKTVNA